MELLIIRLASLVAIAFAYMLFDVLNNRNVPTVFAYSSLAYGVALTVLYLNIRTIVASIGIAVAVLGLGYVVYRIGQLGAGDVIEFAALSLIMPFQGIPVLYGITQLGIPFIISVFIATGVVALVVVPLYYIPRAKKVLGGSISGLVGRKDIFKAGFVGAAWVVFAAFLIVFARIGAGGIIIVAALIFGSVAAVVYEKPMTFAMVDFVGVSRFEEGDIIAFNIMDKRQIDSIKKRFGGFDRLVTGHTIKEMKRRNIRDKVPVYKKAIPLAAPIFIGLVISILFGNLMLLLLPV
jgi:Flp pilus assembly protein protease CpaA